mmetsp:Transcript_3265/g.5753  ORF Transcript_3265/g.5753 Transcript_3265/m.5753 type:complete len:179 (-) Transcript_3265:17-553(-)
MSKGAPKSVGPQLAHVVCGSADKLATAKLNMNCPLGIFLSYSLQTLRVDLEKKIKEVNEEVEHVVVVIPPETPEEELEAVTATAKETCAAEKERLQELSLKLGEIHAMIAATTAHGIELLDEGNGIIQCQDNINSKATDVLKPYNKYTLGIVQENEGEPPAVLPLMVGAAAVPVKKGK